MDWEQVYDAYPVNRQLIWLNNCGTVPAGEHIKEAQARYLAGYAQEGVFSRVAPYADTLARIKVLLSGLLNCLPREVTLVHHTAEGMLFVSQGLDLGPGDEVVLLENEYPSNVYPWRNLASKGVRMVAVPPGEHPDQFIDELSRRLTPRTRVVSLSAVHWCTGMPLPLTRVGELCRERGITFVVDGAQGVGHQPVDPHRDGVDYMAFSAWKWLMGPLGLGGFFVARDKLEDLQPAFWATGSVVDDETYLPYRDELKPDADRFILSTPNFGDWVYFLAALKFLDAIGFERARQRILELNAYLAAGLSDKGFTVLSDRFPEYPTGITVCRKTGLDAAALVGQLKAQGIVVAARLGSLRLAPHIYNSFSQLDRVLDILRRI